MSQSQTASELIAVLADMAKILGEIDWSGKTPERKPAVVHGLSVGKVAIAQRLAATLEAGITRQEREDRDCAQLPPPCDNCDDTHFVTLYVGGDERVVPCRACGIFNHAGAAA